MKKVLLLLVCLCLLSTGAKAVCLSPLESCYHYAQLEADLDALVAAYPAAPVSYREIGESVNGANLYALTLGTGETYALCFAGLHGNEIANTPMIMAAADELLSRWQSGEEQLALLFRQATLIVVPCANPDGYEKTVEYAEKGRRFSAKTNQNKVNLNRNFPTPYWGGKEKRGESDYAGPTQGSEPETQALVALAQEHRYGAMIDLHSRGRQVYYGKGGYVQQDLAVEDSIETLASHTLALAATLLPEKQYKLREQAPASHNGGFGSSTDYLYYLGTPAITIETMPTNYQTATTPKLIRAEYQLLDLPGRLIKLMEAAVVFEQ